MRTRELGGAYAPRCPAMELNLAMRRDFRRAELFGWIIPLPATRSRTLTASPTAVAATVSSPARIANSAFLTKVRAADRYERFRNRRRSETRIRFLDDLLFANLPHLMLCAPAMLGTLVAPTPNWRIEEYHKWRGPVSSSVARYPPPGAAPRFVLLAMYWDRQICADRLSHSFQ